MAGVFSTFLDGSGEPCAGTVSFTPSELRGSSDAEALLGGSRVDLLLDEDGEFEVDLEGGNYRVDIRLRKASTYSREISVPDGGQVNLKWLLSGNAAMPSEAAQAFTAPGPFVYQIPWWATSIDVVLFGAGGAGADGGVSAGLGGGAGVIATATLVRGTGIAWDSATITGTVGAGAEDVAGTASSASATGMTTLSAAGGSAGASANSNGVSPGNATVNGVVYKGGIAQTTKGAVGNGPGGGGGGGNISSGGGAGADGGVYFRAFK